MRLSCTRTLSFPSRLVPETWTDFQLEQLDTKLTPTVHTRLSPRAGQASLTSVKYSRTAHGNDHWSDHRLLSASSSFRHSFTASNLTSASLVYYDKRNLVPGNRYNRGSLGAPGLIHLADYFAINHHHPRLDRRNDPDLTLQWCAKRESAYNDRHFDGIIARKPSTDTPTVRSYRPASTLLHFRYWWPSCAVTSASVSEDSDFVEL